MPSTSYAASVVVVEASASHVIQLANAANHTARIVLLHRLTSRGHQHLKSNSVAPVGRFPIPNIVIYLNPAFLAQPVALRSGTSPRLTRISSTSGVGLTRKVHSLEPINSQGGMYCDNQSNCEICWPYQ